jgi:hypothetical protein
MTPGLRRALYHGSAKDMRVCSDAQMFARISSQTANNDHFRADL